MNKKIISIIPKRETCDTCENGILDINMKMVCQKTGSIVSWKGWCKEYTRLTNKEVNEC